MLEELCLHFIKHDYLVLKRLMNISLSYQPISNYVHFKTSRDIFVNYVIRNYCWNRKKLYNNFFQYLFNEWKFKERIKQKFDREGNWIRSGIKIENRIDDGLDKYGKNKNTGANSLRLTFINARKDSGKPPKKWTCTVWKDERKDRNRNSRNKQLKHV